MENKKKPLAVRIENKREFDSVVNYNDNNGFKNTCGLKGAYMYGVEYITIGAHYTANLKSGHTDGYETISFAAFSTLTGVTCEPEFIQIELSGNKGFAEVHKDSGVKFDEPIQSLSPSEITEIFTAHSSLR